MHTGFFLGEGCIFFPMEDLERRSKCVCGGGGGQNVPLYINSRPAVTLRRIGTYNHLDTAHFCIFTEKSENSNFCCKLGCIINGKTTYTINKYKSVDTRSAPWMVLST